MPTTVQTRDDILMTLHLHKAALQQKFPLHRLALFGSWARSDQSTSSDIDIMVQIIALNSFSRADKLGIAHKQIW